MKNTTTKIQHPPYTPLKSIYLTQKHNTKHQIMEYTFFIKDLLTNKQEINRFTTSISDYDTKLTLCIL